MMPRAFPLLCVCLLAWAVPVWAQQVPVIWPKTFNGQPDFDFERSEIVKELLEKREDLGFDPYVAEVPDILSTERIDPFEPKPRYRRDDGGKGSNNPFLPPELAESEAIQPQDASLTALLPQFDASQTSELNIAVDASASQVDLSEFEGYLKRVIEQKKVRFVDADLSQHNFAPELSFVKLQTVATSPEKYAIINNKRYKVGDRFTLPVQVKAQAHNIEKEIEKLMPAEEAVGALTYARYQALKAEALASYASRAASETAQVRTLEKLIPVQVWDIESRAVILEIYGKRYKLKMRSVY